MSGSAPPVPALTQILAEVVPLLALSIAAAIGMTVAILAIPEARGGVVSAQTRAVAGPAAAVIALLAAAQCYLALTRDGQPNVRHVLVNLIGWLLVAAGLAAMRTRPSRVLAGAVALLATGVALLPTLPRSFGSVGALAHSTLTSLHVLGAMLWVGALVLLATIGMLGHFSGQRRLTGRDRSNTDTDLVSGDWAQVWERFSIVALYCVGALMVSGGWLTWLHVGTPGQLLSTSYGRYLTVKLVLVVALLVTGAYNVRVLLPRIRSARRAGDGRSTMALAVEHFPRVVAVESVIAVGILVVVPFLRGSARAEAGAAQAGAFDGSVAAGGVVLIALTVAVLWAGNRTAR